MVTLYAFEQNNSTSYLQATAGLRYFCQMDLCISWSHYNKRDHSTLTWSWWLTQRCHGYYQVQRNLHYSGPSPHLLLTLYCRVQFEDAHILLSCILLGLGKPCCFLDAHNEAACTLTTLITNFNLIFHKMTCNQHYAQSHWRTFKKLLQSLPST